MTESRVPLGNSGLRSLLHARLLQERVQMYNMDTINILTRYASYGRFDADLPSIYADNLYKRVKKEDNRTGEEIRQDLIKRLRG